MKGVALSLIVFAFPGCALPMYDWREYETSIYRLTVDGASVQDEILVIERDIELTESQGKRVPPGKCAYLGYLYADAGDLERAKECFEREKEFFPESGVFIDGLLRRR